MTFCDFAKHQKPLARQRFGVCIKVEQNTLQNLWFIDTFEALVGKASQKYEKQQGFHYTFSAFYDLAKVQVHVKVDVKRGNEKQKIT